MNKFFLTCLLLAAFAVNAAPAPTLIPFQGRLTDQQGVAYTTGQYTVIFNLYDQAVGGNVLWTETHQKVGVINGTMNVFLGSINTALAGVDFSQARYLGITIDADNTPTTPDPEMVPRQMIIPAIYTKESGNSVKLAGFGWSDLLANGATNPATGFISGTKIATGTLPGTSLADGAIVSDKIALGAIGTNQLQDGSITLQKLAARQVGSNVDIGGVAISSSSGQWQRAANLGAAEVPNLVVSIKTTGRPVIALLVPDGSAQASFIGFNDILQPVAGGVYVGLKRDDGQLVGLSLIEASNAGNDYRGYFPPGAHCFMDLTGPGTHTYKVYVSPYSTGSSASNVLIVNNTKLIVYEL